MLETPAIIGDGEITLREAPELRVEVECPGLAVAMEFGFHSNLGSMRGVAVIGDDLGEVVGDYPKKSGLDDAIHAHLVGIGGCRVIEENVVLEGELLMVRRN